MVEWFYDEMVGYIGPKKNENWLNFLIDFTSGFTGKVINFRFSSEDTYFNFHNHNPQQDVL